MCQCRILLSLIAILFLFAFSAHGDDFLNQTTFNSPQSPGSVIIRYGGLRGLFIDELESQLVNLWTDRIQLNLNYSSIFGQSRQYEELADFLSDYRMGDKWWTRRWYLSEPPDKGGAPYPRLYNLDTVAINLWFFEINSKFRIKVKEYSFSLLSPSTFSPVDYWKIRLKPSMTLGPPFGIRMASFSIIFEYYLDDIKSFDVEIYAQYKNNTGDFGLEFKMFRW